MKFEDFLRNKADKLELIQSEDDFNNWLERLDGDDWLKLAEEWGTELVREVRELVKDEVRRGVLDLDEGDVM